MMSEKCPAYLAEMPTYTCPSICFLLRREKEWIMSMMSAPTRISSSGMVVLNQPRTDGETCSDYLQIGPHRVTVFADGNLAACMMDVSMWDHHQGGTSQGTVPCQKRLGKCPNAESTTRPVEEGAEAPPTLSDW